MCKDVIEMNNRKRVPVQKRRAKKKTCLSKWRQKISVCCDKVKLDLQKTEHKRGLSEMFNFNDQYNKFSTKNLKCMNLKYKLFQCFLFLMFLFILVIFFYGINPPHFELQLPRNEDIGRHTLLRDNSKILYKKNILLRVISFLEESCDVFSSYTLLFCHNILTNKMPILEPCFMDCRDKQFYYGLEIEKTDNDELITCNEVYGDTESKQSRYKNILIRGVRNFELEKFTNIPNSSLESCIFQHGVDVSSGTWKA